MGDLSGSRAEVIFTSFDLGFTSSSVNDDDRVEPALKVPLPRPRGTIDTTFCDRMLNTTEKVVAASGTGFAVLVRIFTSQHDINTKVVIE